MKTRGRLHEVVHRHTMTIDAVLALLLLAGCVMAARKDDPGYWSSDDQTWYVRTLEAVIFLALVFLRTWPVQVFAVTLTGGATLMLLLDDGTGEGTPVAVPVVAALLAIAHRSEKRTTVCTALGVGVVMVVAGSVRSGDWFSAETVSVLAWIGFAAALGQAIRSQKAYVAAVEERARRAEQTREEEAGRRVIEERLRIARELHDVVAHHIAVIQVQSGVVDHLLTESPDAAREALGHVRRSSRMVLDELGDMLDVLRQPDDPITPTDPAPGLNRLLSLIDDFAASGLKVEWRVSGTPLPLPTAVDLVAYRLVQEGLTNAHKHGTGAAQMVLGFEPTGLVIDVVNRVKVPVNAGGIAGDGMDAGPVPSLGHGLSGMRERAHAVGGAVTTAQEDGTWRVRARIPLSGEPGTDLPAGPGAGPGPVPEPDDDPACRRWLS